MYKLTLIALCSMPYLGYCQDDTPLNSPQKKSYQIIITKPQKENAYVDTAHIYVVDPISNKQFFLTSASKNTTCSLKSSKNKKVCYIEVSTKEKSKSWIFFNDIEPIFYEINEWNNFTHHQYVATNSEGDLIVSHLGNIFRFFGKKTDSQGCNYTLYHGKGILDENWGKYSISDCLLEKWNSVCLLGIESGILLLHFKFHSHIVVFIKQSKHSKIIKFDSPQIQRDALDQSIFFISYNKKYQSSPLKGEIKIYTKSKL